MKTKITTYIAIAVMLFSGVQAQTSCSDLNGYVNYKNVGGTGSYLLQSGAEESAAQTYNYSGPGKITSVRVTGNYTASLGGVPLRVGIYNVDASGRPTTAIQTVNTIWWIFDNSTGYINVPFSGGGVTVSNRFAVTIQILNAFPFGTSFNLAYTGNGEGHGQDLASLAGTSTGSNWSSAKNAFNKDGDFYLVPNMTHYITPSFSMTSVCLATNVTAGFTNQTQMTTDSMFNKIGLSGYTGTNKFYTWNFGDGSPVSNLTNPTHAYTTSGVYTVSLTARIDGWAGNCSSTYTAKVSVGLAASATAISNITCYGAGNGSFTAGGTGGATTYSYSLNGISYQTSSSFSGLSAGTKTLFVKDKLGCINTTTFAITQPTGISYNSVSTTNASCGNSDGAILASASGGSGSLQYKIDNGTYQSSGAFSALSAGVHTVTVQDANSCTTTTLITVNDLGGPSINGTSLSQVSCNGGSNGSIVVNAGGGTGSLLYSINGGATTQSSSTFSGLSAGTYAVLIKDGANCTDVTSITISQPPVLNLTASSNSTACYGASSGQITILSSSGGTGSHNYSINGSNYQSGTIFSGLSAGTYTAYVKDVANCISTTTVVVTQPSAVSAVASQTASACNGSADGVISLAGSGGTGNMLYSIDGLNFQPNNMFTNLLAGAYTLSVKDANNCTFTLTSTVSQPAAITTTVGTTNSTCGNNNGSALVIGGGGAGSFQYSINGINYNSTGQFSLLASGTYYLIVQDVTGCNTIVSAIVADSNGPSILNHSHVNVSCNGGNNGSISITNVTGGSGALLYSINGITWQSSSNFSNLPAGSYIVRVKDANGCTGTASVTLTQPNAFLINPIISDASCYGASTGASTITAAGGAGVLAFSLNNGLTFQSSNVFNNLLAGSYNVIVKDAANCTGNQSFVINQPPAIIISTGVLDVKCFGLNTGAISAIATGGTGSLMYSINGFNYQQSGTFNNLPGNISYLVFVKDATGCVQTTQVVVAQPAPVVVYPSQTNVSCAGGNNGAINLAVSGGVYPYTYQWSNGLFDQGIFNLPADSYSVVVTDNNGCSSVYNFTVTQPSNPLVINASIVDASGGSINDGSIDITVTGGQPPYTFNWSNNVTNEDLYNLFPGAYLINVVDANGCVSSSTFLVGNITGLENHAINDANILVYPQPASDNVTIETKGFTAEQVEIYNALGQKILVQKMQEPLVIVNTSQFSGGLYYMQIHAQGQIIIKRMVINK